MNEEGVDWIAWAALAAMVCCLGSGFLWFALVLTQFDGWVAGSMRLILSGVFLISVAVLSRAGLPNTTQEWRGAAAYGIVGFMVPFYLVAHAQEVVPSNVVGIFFAASPIVILILSRLVLGVQITARKKLGFAVGSVGLVLMAGPGVLSQIGPEAGLWPSVMLAVAAVSIAGSAIVARLMPPMSPVRSAAGATVVAGGLSLPIFLTTLPLDLPQPASLTGLIAGAVLTTGCGHLLRVFLVRRKGPVFLAPVGYLTVLLSVFLGVVVLSERLTPETLIAAAVILTGVLIAQDGSGNLEAK